MVRYIAVGFALALCASGCAGLGLANKPPEADARLDKLSQSQTRLEMRVDEVTRSLLLLRERVDAQELGLKEAAKTIRELREFQAEPLTPPLTVVRVEPLGPDLPPPRPAATEPAPPKPAPSASAEPPADSAPADLYRRAFTGFREGSFGQAVLDFEEFLRLYPQHEYADDAQYWIGDAYFSQGEYAQAVVEFNRVLDRYPDGSKVPEALLKIGLCYDKLGEPEKAKVFWNRLSVRYPDNEATLQAKKFLLDSGRRSP